jgi:hypothetical protein
MPLMECQKEPQSCFLIPIFLLFASFHTYGADLPQYLSNIPKAHVCEKNVDLSPIELSIAFGLRFIANGNQKEAAKLSQSNARTAMLTMHDELCRSDIKNARDYMLRLTSACERTCEGKADCLRICNTVRDVHLVYLEGVLSGRTACPAAGNITPPKAVR